MKRWLAGISLKNKLILMVVAFGSVPMIVMSFVSYYISRNQILDNVKAELYNRVQQNNEIISIYLEQAEQSALLFTVDEKLVEILNEEREYTRTEILHRNLEIKSLMNKYFMNIPNIFSFHLYTDKFRIVGNYADSKISSSVPPMYIPYDTFTDSALYRTAAEANGRIVWISTYNYETVYGMERFKDIKYDYRYLFSAVKQINCVEDPERIQPILVVSYKPDFFDRILKNGSDGGLPEGTLYYVTDAEGQVVYSNGEEHPGGAEDILEKITAYGDSGVQMLSGDGEKYIAAYDNLGLMDWKQTVLVPEKAYMDSVSRMPGSLLIFTIFISILSVVMAGLVARNMTRGIHLLIKGMQRLEEGEFLLHLPRSYDSEINMLIDKFNEMDGKINTLITNNYKMQIREKEAQIMALSRQLNPHFLYNTLNSINVIAINGGQREISDAIVSLSKILHNALNIKNDRCTFREELAVLKDYLYIMKLRFMDMFEVRFSIEEKLLDTKVPYFMLQPLIENAIEHGFADLERGGVIWLQAYTGQDEKRYFCISDNGQGFESQQETKFLSEGVGLANIRHRLHLIYGDEQQFLLESRPGEGTRITIILP